MRWFFISFLIIYLGAHYYIFHRVSSDLRLTHNASVWFLLVICLLAFFGVFNQIFIYHHAGHNANFNFVIEFAYIWVGMLSIAFTLLFFGNILFIFFKNPQIRFYITSTALFLTVFVTIYSYINVKVNSPIVKKIEIKVPNLSVDKFTIVQISDMHINLLTKPAEIKKIVAMVNSLNPDIVAMTGDFIDTDISQTFQDYDIDKIKSKYGIFAVSGNHEYYRGIDKFKTSMDNIGYTLIDNKNILINDIIYIAGISDFKASKRFGYEISDFGKAFEGIDFLKPVIFLSHQPEAFAGAEKYPFTLQLSGHTHAGQVPPFDIIEKIIFKHFYGLYNEDGKYIYVTSGTRWWGPPLRLFSKSEIVYIQLYRGN
ncbi:MAG: metallophosphoesterase [Endomicrobiaceae bacterium]|nr:metallophosphoesterase [Endomicrobiaceae bacterium]